MQNQTHYLLAKYERPVPRYTSYPTAPQFHDGVGAATYGGWLEALDTGAALSLYLHIPFCDSLCWFCGCHTKIVRRTAPVEAYVETLLGEIDLVTERLGGGQRVTHLHRGGGSPTLLSPDDMRRIGARLRNRFRIDEAAEFAVEIDPRGLDDATVEAMAEIGVNRVSIGVQDVHPQVQAAVNRIQPCETTRNCVERLRAAGLGAINCDLMYGLPYQDTSRVVASVEAVLGLDPDRLALFGYAHVPHMKRHQRLIPEQARAALAADGLVEVSGHRVRVTETGRPFVRQVAAVFDTYLQGDPAQHARAV